MTSALAKQCSTPKEIDSSLRRTEGHGRPATHTGQAYSIGEAMPDAKGNRVCFHENSLEQKAIEHPKCLARDSHTGQAYDFGIDEAMQRQDKRLHKQAANLPRMASLVERIDGVHDWGGRWTLTVEEHWLVVK
ncbi:hypothetical protein HBI56_020800 [Parastagonospora nodorum]|nr:hypothetical protein HBH56_173770 [Parastagonospora nodorum]KAH3926378.1 hypothetical protein HBH54_169330 [Parastagonospora nodorum]KAH3982497.1 hypothetical protein HBH52_074790 [Parastagonospora nodorum]KAH4007487.1 hypothetical protein HBI10_007790 [Parastagonospora nodorum]KAH4023522.1 hypothetical protein HBI13_089500 [Parastagonospora nodorum]